MIYVETTISSLSKYRANTQNNEENLESYPRTRASKGKTLWNAETKEENRNSIRRKRTEIHTKNKRKNTFTSVYMSEEEESTTECLIDKKHALKETNANKRIATVILFLFICFF